jgi:hypothetical protein
MGHATAKGALSNSESEQVIGDDEANALLRDRDRGYRAPFVVPEKV